MKVKKITQKQFIKEWFIANAYRDITHEESKKAIERAYEKQTGKRLEDCDRGIRSLAQRGFLIKIAKGVIDMTHRKFQRKHLKSSPVRIKNSFLNGTDLSVLTVALAKKKVLNYT